MPRNLEIKARISSMRSVISIARAIGAVRDSVMRQTDTYYSVGRGRLKLREIRGKRAELIGYVRNESSNRRLSNYVSARIVDTARIKSMLADSLGRRGIVVKRRVLYRLASTRIHVDQVKGLGTFLEFETAVTTTPAKARNELGTIMRAFGIARSDLLRGSYIDLLEERRRGRKRGRKGAKSGSAARI